MKSIKIYFLSNLDGGEDKASSAGADPEGHTKNVFVSFIKKRDVLCLSKIQQDLQGVA